jgi:hypothetical protein
MTKTETKKEVKKLHGVHPLAGGYAVFINGGVKSNYASKEAAEKEFNAIVKGAKDREEITRINAEMFEAEKTQGTLIKEMLEEIRTLRNEVQSLTAAVAATNETVSQSITPALVKLLGGQK